MELHRMTWIGMIHPKICLSTPPCTAEPAKVHCYQQGQAATVTLGGVDETFSSCVHMLRKNHQWVHVHLRADGRGEPEGSATLPPSPAIHSKARVHLLAIWS